MQQAPLGFAIEQLAKKIDETKALYGLLLDYRRLKSWTPIHSHYTGSEIEELRAIERRVLERRIRLAAHYAGFDLPPLDCETDKEDIKQ